MLFYDTASRALRPLEPVGGRVGIYVCGITPYDGGHLGHAFTYHTFDVIRRRLQRQQLDVRLVRNITDVDDDIIRVARERGRDYRELGDEQVANFERDMVSIGLEPPTVVPRATGTIPGIVELVGRLEQAGVAYVVDGWVYFEVGRHPRYGELSHLGRDEMVELARERGGNPDDPRKRAPLDFVLWQPSLPDEPHWSSPWSEGRPGWHIECSVMASEHLGLPVDIHGGGDDLIYPHHESEIAQVEAVTPAPFVRHWVHVAMVAYAGEKMSKSLGNLVFVSELVARAPAGAVRLLLAMHHRRQAWAYEEPEFQQAIGRHAALSAAIAGARGLELSAATELIDEFNARLDDDLDTAGALAVLERAAALSQHGPGPAGAGTGVLAELLGILGIAPA